MSRERVPEQGHERRGRDVTQRLLLAKNRNAVLETASKRPLLSPTTSTSCKRIDNPARNQGEEKEHACSKCLERFDRPYVRDRHFDARHTDKRYYCWHEKCAGKKFTREDTLIRHNKTKHGPAQIPCPSCGKRQRSDWVNGHMSTKACIKQTAKNKAQKTANLLAIGAAPQKQGSRLLTFHYRHHSAALSHLQTTLRCRALANGAKALPIRQQPRPEVKRAIRQQPHRAVKRAMVRNPPESSILKGLC